MQNIIFFYHNLYISSNRYILFLLIIRILEYIQYFSNCKIIFIFLLYLKKKKVFLYFISLEKAEMIDLLNKKKYNGIFQ
jgi:hypothetical protein